MAAADVQLEHGYLKLANRLATAIALAPWDSPSQPRMVMALIRATFGFRRRDAAISNIDWHRLTGLSERQVKRTKQSLTEQGVLIIVKDFDARRNTPATWRLRKDFTKWGIFAVSPAAVDDAESVNAKPEPEAVSDPVSQADPGVTHDTRTPVSAMSPGPVSPVTPGPVSRMVPGYGSNSINGNDLQDRKDTRKTLERHLLADNGADAPDRQPKNGVRKRTPRKPSEGRGTRLPDDWKPNATHRRIASELSVDLERELPKFRDHHTAKGTVFKDWDAGFRTWLRNAVEFRRGPAPGSEAARVRTEYPGRDRQHAPPSTNGPESLNGYVWDDRLGRMVKRA